MEVKPHVGARPFVPLSVGIAAPGATVAVFGGPWDTGHRAQDGAINGFADAEHAVADVFGSRVVTLDIADFLNGALAERLRGVDVVFANCGPIAALLMQLRAVHRLDFALYREVRTLGWIGYAFQEFVAHELARPRDRCLHVSEYCRSVWGGVRDGGGDHLFYPQLRRPRRMSAPLPDAPRTCGYFSRLSADKGFGELPAIIAKLRGAGWPVRALSIAGAVESPALLEQVRSGLAGSGVALHYLGDLEYAAALEAMAAVDVVLFPSVSSIEACGRVVLEAYDLGKRVIASDYCAGADVLTPAWRIPLVPGWTVTGASADAFAVGDLALDAWSAPAWRSANFIEAACERYRHAPAALQALAAAGPPCVEADRALDMRFDWEGLRGISAGAWCEQVQSLLIGECRDRRDLLDLGGAFKRSLRRAGFAPAVSFATKSPP